MKQDREPWTRHRGRKGGPAVLPTVPRGPAFLAADGDLPGQAGPGPAPHLAARFTGHWASRCLPRGAPDRRAACPEAPLCSRPTPPGNVAQGNWGVLQFITRNFSSCSTDTRMRWEKALKEAEDQSHTDVRSACGGFTEQAVPSGLRGLWSPRSLQGRGPQVSLPRAAQQVGGHLRQLTAIPASAGVS